MSRNKRRNHGNLSIVDSVENKASVRIERKASFKIASIVLILLFVLVGFGALAKWKGSELGGSFIERTGSGRRVSGAVQPMQTPQYAADQPAKEYIYAGSKLLATSAPITPIPADLAVWRPSTGVWYVLGGPGSSQTTSTWGQSGDVPVPGDYDGDGKTDFSVFRPGNNQWYIVHSSTGAIVNYEFGATDDKPAQADYDGDGKTDAAVFRPSTNVWHILGSSAGYYTTTWGASGDTPASADYDGDGKADLGVWRSSNSTFYSINSSNQGLQTVALGQNGNKPVSADYDGDGKADYAVYNSGTADWYIRQSTNFQIITVHPSWSNVGDVEVPNDYDGDGKVDVAVWRNSNGNWYIRQSSLLGQTDELRNVSWGQSGDIPVPAFYRR